MMRTTRDVAAGLVPAVTGATTRVAPTNDADEPRCRGGPCARPHGGDHKGRPYASAIGSFNSFAAFLQKIFSRCGSGMSRSRINWIARGLSEVSGGASLP